MRRRNGRAALLLAAFAAWTIAIHRIDVQPIGPNGSHVGFAALNGFAHRLTGVNWSLYRITDWLGLVPIAVAMGFAALGLAQWIRRRSIAKVDRSLLALGGLYIAALAAYLLFEARPINYRPVFIGGYLEASYPSSTALLVLCVMPTAARQWNARIRRKAVRRGAIAASRAFAALMVAGRFLAGVHWITDIIGGALLAAGLVSLYDFACKAK